MHAALPRSPNFRPLKMYAQLWPVDAVKSDPVTPKMQDAPDEYGPETFDREPPVLQSSFRLKASSSPAQSCPWWQSGLITRTTRGTQSGQIFRTNWHDSAPWYHDVSSLPCDLLVAARRDGT